MFFLLLFSFIAVNRKEELYLAKNKMYEKQNKKTKVKEKKKKKKEKLLYFGFTT